MRGKRSIWPNLDHFCQMKKNTLAYQKTTALIRRTLILPQQLWCHIQKQRGWCRTLSSERYYNIKFKEILDWQFKETIDWQFWNCLLEIELFTGGSGDNHDEPQHCKISWRRYHERSRGLHRLYPDLQEGSGSSGNNLGQISQQNCWEEMLQR